VHGEAPDYGSEAGPQGEDPYWQWEEAGYRSETEPRGEASHVSTQTPNYGCPIDSPEQYGNIDDPTYWPESTNQAYSPGYSYSTERSYPGDPSDSNYYASSETM
jgi:hypothetical protein